MSGQRVEHSAFSERLNVERDRPSLAGNRPPHRGERLFGQPWLWPIVVLTAAYGFAWAETFAMTGGAIAEQFTYRDLPRMLRWGSLFYATYFVVSFPMIDRLDEEPGDNWPLRRVAVEALAAGMLLLFLLDGLTRFVGRIY